MVINNGTPNYPDILGFVTGGERLLIANCVEVAIAVRPQTVTAGKPFAVVALLQNVTDVSVKVMAVLQLPGRDADGQNGRFAAKETSKEVTLFPAEVGYLVLPVNCRIETATGDGYSIGATFHAKPLGKPRRVRSEGAPASLDYYFQFTPSTLERLARLKNHTFSIAKRGFLGGKTLTSEFTVKPGGEQKITRKNPNWIRLWTISANTDARPLVERYAHVLMRQVIPQLETEALYRALLPVTQQRLWSTGYDIAEAESHYITKLLVSVLQLARESQSNPAYEGEDVYRLAHTVETDWPDDGSPVPVPHWTRTLLERVGYDAVVVENTISALSGPLYDDLLDDAIHHGFSLVNKETGLGFSRRDMTAYSAQVTDSLWDPESSLGMLEMYLPLILGGILVDEMIVIPHENKLDNLNAIRDILEAAKASASTDDQLVIDLAEDMTAKIMAKYGYRMGRY